MKIICIFLCFLFLLTSCAFNDNNTGNGTGQEQKVQDFQIRGTLGKDSQISGIDKNLIGQKDTVYYVVGPYGDDMSGNINRFLVPKKIMYSRENTYYEDRILTALNTLFSIKTERIDDTHTNSLSKSDLKVEKIELKEGTMNIYLKGKIIGSGSLLDAFIKPQINKTIQAYSTNYKVFLNGSEKEWRCALDMSGECN